MDFILNRYKANGDEDNILVQETDIWAMQSMADECVLEYGGCAQVRAVGCRIKLYECSTAEYDRERG